jgi:succinate-semialdehyde dehydrogenase / glutarate-semialdehyde dehydrogenase
VKPPLQDPSLLREQCFVNGQWAPADSGRTRTILNPANNSVFAHVPDMGEAETHRAIEGAHDAWPAWRSRTSRERSVFLRKWHDLILAHTDDLALIMTYEQGKPLAEARGEIAYAASFIEWFSEEAKRTYGDTIPSPAPNRHIVVVKQPVGVCAVITPWNFPAAMIARKVAPALAAGCTVVAKPAEQTPLTALALAELASRAGLPAGVLQVLTGDPKSIGAVLTSSPVVRKLSFTGSTQTGRLLMTQCAPTLKRLSLELGGNAPFIVFDDADLDAAVEGLMASKFRNTGQTCVCANRILVQDSIYETFSAMLANKMATLQVGRGWETGVTQGPLINEASVQKVEKHVADALAKGARIVCGGRRHALGGTYYEPTLLVEAKPDTLCAREETFGPVAPLFRFNTEAEAIFLANDTEFGLAGYLFSRNGDRCIRVAEALECGMIGINTGMFSNEVSPFGGIKQSGLGREGGKYGIEEYLEIKYLNICVSGPPSGLSSKP